MAKLSDETLTTVFNLQKQFLESIDAATATEFIIFERFGETEETIPELNELDSAKFFFDFGVLIKKEHSSTPRVGNVRNWLK